MDIQILLEIIFWICLTFILHTYLFYHLSIRIFARNKKGNTKIFKIEDEIPFVSILIAAHNEETVISDKILSIVNSSFPETKIEVLVGSDCSTDKTNKIIEQLIKEYACISIVKFENRTGKIGVINSLIEKAKYDLVLLTDANVMFDKQSIFELVKHFKNEEIGLVDSKMINIGIKKDGISLQEKTYISTEVSSKNAESLLWGTMMGPFGGCFALRKKLWEKIPSHFLVDDFFINMLVLQKGFKSINEPNAIVFEDVSNDLSDEFRRKIRISSGNFQNLFHYKHLLFDFSWIAFSFFSHKVLRWLTPFFILSIISILPFIIENQSFYFYFLIGIIFCFSLVSIDFLLKSLKVNIKLLRFLTHFTLMNVALFIGFLNYIKGVKSSIWDPTRRNQ
jgi:cellulose synthase/poly-beta-1,6-N-acetylglucosamine synthase-like glycosyltransferase